MNKPKEMKDQHCEITKATSGTDEAQDRLWPSPVYTRQIEALKSAIGKKVYLVELKPGDINMGIRLSDTAFELLGVVDFPRPDPTKGIAPHLILLDDGRGINLGHIARISLDTPFSPSAANTLYQDRFLMQNLLLRKRRLSKASIAAKSKALLGRMLGKPLDNPLIENGGSICESDGTTNRKQVKKAQ
ncbi:MAG: hypothetical protein JMN25_12095 [gamma proteobacterium endosymbiont of Lamellibrachia anaximandri]|nr:hypothetical protein [gamma proteobacterium endosymbiont of Lamellibrachia anaximandri]